MNLRNGEKSIDERKKIKSWKKDCLNEFLNYLSVTNIELRIR